MLNLKKTAVAVLAFGSSAVFAGTMGPVCTPGSVTVPCEKTAWDLGVQALYLKPAYSDSLGWGAVHTVGDSQTYVENDPKWSWGFKLEGSYHFNTGNDLNLNWYHLGGRTETRNFASGFSFFNLEERDTARSSIKPRWDAVNLEFGQHVDFGEMKNIRFHGGVQYARIKTEYSNVGSDLDGLFTHTAVATASYNGFGPRVGADMSYDWGNGVGIYANAAAALLAGTSKFDRTYTDNAGNPNTVPVHTAGSRTAVVPELEAKLGANYTWAMAQGDLTLDVGYMWVNYFDVQAHGSYTAATASMTQDSNFSLNGPFLGLKWVGSVV